MSQVKIMVVGDEIPFVQTLERRLVQRGLEVLSAYGGSEALEKMAEDPTVDIVLLSVKMAGMDGIETLKQIRMFHPLVEVIMLTGCDTLDAAIEGMSLGAYDYVLRPCDVDGLVAKVALAEGKKAKQEEKILEAKLKEIALRRGNRDGAK